MQLVNPEQWDDQAPMLVQMVVDHQELELEMTEERALVMLAQGSDEGRKTKP